jgi:hypothetical protein
MGADSPAKAVYSTRKRIDTWETKKYTRSLTFTFPAAVGRQSPLQPVSKMVQWIWPESLRS